MKTLLHFLKTHSPDRDNLSARIKLSCLKALQSLTLYADTSHQGGPLFSPRFMPYPPACKLYGLEAEPEATIPVFHHSNYGHSELTLEEPLVDESITFAGV